MKKILITGSSGFVGTNLYKSLYKDFTLIGLDITTKGAFPVESVYSWEALNALPDVDVIIHLAGKAHDTKNQTNADAYFEINTALTQKIYDWFLKSNAKKFVFFSSVKAAADSVTGDILTEDVIPAPRGPYGESKIAAEKYILSEWEKWCHLERLVLSAAEVSRSVPGKQVYILRPCMIHGPGNKGNLNLLYKIVKKGIPWPLASFDNQRSFCSIENLSFVIRSIIEKNIKSGIYNIADDQPVSTNELINLIAEAQGKKARLLKINKSIILFFAKIGDLLHLPLNSERLKKLTESFVVSNKKLKKALNIQKMPFDVKQGLLKTINSFNK